MTIEHLPPRRAVKLIFGSISRRFHISAELADLAR
jgi:hypothetical protein